MKKRCLRALRGSAPPRETGRSGLTLAAVCLGGFVVLSAAAPADERPCDKPSTHGGPGLVAKDVLPELYADAIFAAYSAADEQVLVTRFTTEPRFEQFRKDFRTRLLETWWLQPREPIRALFMMDVALIAYNSHFRYWLDFVEEGRRYLTDRPEAIGAKPGLDAFEIQWHKTNVALLSGMRRPDFLASCGIDPLDSRMATESRAADGPRLVDPWIAFARGYGDEAYTLASPANLAEAGPAAITHYDRALAFESTRAEAAVRKAAILTRLGKPADAVAALDAFKDTWTSDQIVLYWSRLFRGQALQKAGQLEEAAAAFTRAHTLIPEAQTPKVALMTLELQRSQPDAAYGWADKVKNDREFLGDPFWVYPVGDRRVFASRLAALRKLARP